jgi:protein tyrosine/serine phosphatase
MSARKAAPRDEYLRLFDIFDTAERPMVMHCKSGADRTGIASALYLLVCEGAPMAEARKQLRFWPFLHLKRSATGILDHILDLYERRCATTGPIAIRDWFATEYDPVVATESFAAHRARGFRWPEQIQKG